MAGCSFGGEDNPYEKSPDFYQPVEDVKTTQTDSDKKVVIDISESMFRVQQTVASHQCKPGRLNGNH